MTDAPSGPDDFAPSGATFPYRRTTFLARGGTATVYTATRESDGQPVVVKVFDLESTTSATRQLEAAERLGDVDGVLAVLDHGTLEDGRHYLVSPYLVGGSLGDRMERFGATEPAATCRLGASLARSLQSAHDAGILHRDLKPSNVLLDEAGQPILADFGAAQTLDAATATETMVLTTIYAAPELLQGGPASVHSDVYSLGLTVLAVAIGHHPIPASSTSGLATLVSRICDEGAPDPASFEVPAGLAAVIRRATAYDPADRHPDAAALAADLDALASDPSAVIAGSDRRTKLAPIPRARRRRLIAAGAATAAVIAIIATAVG